MIQITQPANQQALDDVIQQFRELLGDQQEGPDVLATLTNCIVTEPRATRDLKRYHAALDKAKALIDAEC